MGNQNEIQPFIFAMAILRYDIGMTSEFLLSQKRGFYSFKKVTWVKVTQYLKSDLESDSFRMCNVLIINTLNQLHR